MKTNILIISILYLYSLNIIEEKKTLIYDLKVSGKSIGNVTATKSIDNDLTTYTSNTDAVVSMLIDIKIKTRMTVIFKDGKLIESDYKFYKNNKLKETATIIYKDSSYIMTHDGEVSEINTPITASTIMLPFYTPKHDEKIFEEVEGNFKIMKLITEGNYTLVEPKTNHKDDYTYHNGIMKSCLVRNTLVNFEMTLKTY